MSVAKPNKKDSKLLQTFLEHLRSPATLGLVLTAAFVFVTNWYYSIKHQNENDRNPNALFDIIERIDFAVADFRFRIRGPRTPSAPVALVAIDNRSVEEMGEWPWPRTFHARVLDQLVQYGARAVGLDVIFSEEQKDSGVELAHLLVNQVPANLPAHQLITQKIEAGFPDAVLAKTVEKHSDRIVLGAFAEDSFSKSPPYQDYCRSFAFKYDSLNAAFIFNDEADQFADLPFKDFFDVRFAASESLNRDKLMKDFFQKKRLEDLTEREQRQLQILLTDQNMRFCDTWLTANDTTIQDNREDYLKLFALSEGLKGLNYDEAIDRFKTSVRSFPVAPRRRWTLNNPTVQSKAQHTASFNAELDPDGTIRNTSLFFRTGNLIFIPSLALQTYLVANGYQARIDIGNDPKNPSQKLISKFVVVDPNQDPESMIGSIPVDFQGRMRINYFGGPNTFPYVPAKELLNDKDSMQITQMNINPASGQWEEQTLTVKKADFINGRSFIYGATATGVYDLRVTPFDKNFPGPETHVNTLANLYERNFLSEHPNEQFIMTWVVAVLGLLFSIFVAVSGATVGFLGTLISFAVLGFIDFYFFKRGFVITSVLPGLMLGSLYVVQTFYKYFTEERKKKHLKSTFSKYVSPAIVDEILKSPENVQLGGMKKGLTVMFSDVRGFTTISEKLDPQALSDVLNRYLTPMTEIVFANKGTLDKYMGDAIMAFFGAPVYYEEHAKYACRTALQMLTKLKDIQDLFVKENLPHIDIGIGINTGEMSVGNMGSEIVRSYTVMGDAVNLASRLEGINKEYGTRIVISEFTYKQVKEAFTSREIDWVRVKGKKEPVRIFELLCEGKSKEPLQTYLDKFAEAFRTYHEMDFVKAKSEFEALYTENNKDQVAKLYIDRCESFIESPPPSNWDGVFIMKTK